MDRPEDTKIGIVFQEKGEASCITQVRENMVHSKSSAFMYDHIMGMKRAVERMRLDICRSLYYGKTLCVNWGPFKTAGCRVNRSGLPSHKQDSVL